jgi:hypothetical protein
MDCRHLEDGYEIYLLGALDRGEHEELDQHIRQGCRSCTGELREAAENLYWFLQTVAPVQPSAAMKSRLLQRLTHNGVRRVGSKKLPATALSVARQSPPPPSRR